MHPDVAFEVNKLSQFMHHPTNDHWKAIKCILCFMYSQMLTAPETMMIIPPPMPISCILDKIQSTWSSKKQHTIARSLTEAEYHFVATTAAKLSCVCKLLTELGVVIPQVPVIYYDNIGANHLCSYHVFHSRMKHVTLDYYFVRDQVQSGTLHVAYVSSNDKLSHTLTKPLPRKCFVKFKTKIGFSSQNSILWVHIGECK